MRLALPVSFEGVSLIDPATGTSVGPRTIDVVDGVIAAIRSGEPGGEMADQRWVLPGLVNAHDHLYSHELRTPNAGMDLAEMRRWIDSRDPYETLARMIGQATAQMRMGILAIRDVGSAHGLNTVLSRLIALGVISGPQIVASGRPIVMTGGHVWTFGREADGVDDCRRAVREQAKAGAKVIKVMGSGGLSHYPVEDFRRMQFTDAELRATIDEAHAVGLLTCAHVYGAEAVDRVVELGIDSVEHGIEIKDSTLAAMASRDVSYVPTLSNMERIASEELNRQTGTPERASAIRAGVVDPQQATFRRARAIGIRIGLGTDSLGDYAEELALMGQLGMSSREIIAAATVNGARIVGLHGYGVATGNSADFLVYGQDPREHISILTKPDVVVRNGRVFLGEALGEAL